MNVEIETEAAKLLFRKYLIQIFSIVSLQGKKGCLCKIRHIPGAELGTLFSKKILKRPVKKTQFHYFYFDHILMIIIILYVIG
jgi:hypothetical protein